jgi:hypothetical protein
LQCLVCGNNFIPTNPNHFPKQIYCSKKCRVKLQNKRTHNKHLKPKTTKFCLFCGKEFMPLLFHQTEQKFCCLECGRKHWRLNNKDKFKIYQKRFKEKHGKRIRAIKRKTTLGASINGKVVYYKNVIKRDFPLDNLCELCHTKPPKGYHHWRDSDIEESQRERKIIAGLWLCNRCHTLVEDFENESVQKILLIYLCKKELIDKKLGYI